MIEDPRPMSTSRLQQILTTAIQKRAHLLDDSTNSLRLLDGEGDGLPGIYLESYGGAWLVSTQGPHLSQDLKNTLREMAPSLYWKRLDQHQKESPIHLGGTIMPEYFTGTENGVHCRLSFQSGYSQGIFLDQRENRAKLRALSSPDKTVLNTFAYTGVFSVTAALGGAKTTTLDLSQVYLDWAKENFTLNQLDPDVHYFCKGGTFHWLKRFAKQSRTFDFIILDPPTFSRDDKGKVFRAERDYGKLFKLALACLSKNGMILACTNARRISTGDFKKQLQAMTAGPGKFQAATMPEDFSESPYLKSIWYSRR